MLSSGQVLGKLIVLSTGQRFDSVIRFWKKWALKKTVHFIISNTFNGFSIFSQIRKSFYRCQCYKREDCYSSAYERGTSGVLF